MSTSTLLQSIKESRRDALVNHYIANNVPRELMDKITDADSLYEYLLLDTKISELVKTSPIAEAISSVQLYMNRCVEGYEGKLTPEGNGHFGPGKFLDNWDTYNKRYSTWAGKERLKYYAGSYIDPSLRYNKTDPFLNLEQGISQGRLTDDTVKNALQHYLTEYEVLADLEYISVNKGADESDLFFVGRTKTMPYEYYWRRLTLKKDNNNKLVPAIWSQWKKITANIGEALDNYAVLFWYKNRLHVQWCSTEKTQNDAGEAVEKQYLNDWILNSSGVWSSFRKSLLIKNSFGFSEVLNIDPNNITSIRNQLFCDDPGAFKITLTALPDKRVHINFVTNYRDKNYSLTIGGGISLLEGEQLVVDDWRFIGSRVVLQTGEGYSPSFWLSYYGDTIQNSYGSINNDQYTPPSGSNIKGPIDLTLKNNIDLSVLLEESLDALFNYTIQGDNQLGGMVAFNGPYGLYLWEIFFHVPFLMAVRFHTEQRYELAERWFKFIFNSAGYRDDYGNLLADEKGNVRYWNVVPLQEDTEWDDTLSLATTDPDEIAMADPMQYKLAIFIHTLDFLINRGDSLYRMLEQDTLTEAKMYYIQASQLLGPRPEIRINHSWPDPTLQSEADAVTAVPTRSGSPAAPILALRALLKAENGHFLPPYNDELLAFWDKIDLRLYNLRHNLSLDGQPLHLPLFAEPVNPRELQVQHGAGDGLGGSTGSVQSRQSVYRFPLVIDKARNAANSVIQFGNALENALTKQDSEAMTMLLQSQQQIVLQQTRDIQEKNLDALQASLEAAMTAKAGAESRKTHFAGLADNWMSANETASLALRTTAGIINTSSTVPIAIAGGLDMAPNVFGFAVGGSRWGAVSTAVAQGLQITAGVMEQTATIIDISESYRRRREDWMLQRDIAENEAAQLDSQIAALREQMDMERKQLALAETEQAHAQAVYELQSTRFTNQALYNWMAGRLSSLYYQMYDAALPLCMMAKQALEKEIGNGKTVGLFTLPAWNDLYQGLLAGEALLLELQKLENLWLEEDKRGMEAVRTVSLDTHLRKEKPESGFADFVKEVLDGKTPDPVGGVSVQLQNNIFSATLDLSTLGLDRFYNQAEKAHRIKNLSVTLPALLGPYQDIAATLSLGGETVALSHGVDDSGLFITDLNDSRFLPFEGMDPLSGTLVLSIFHAGQDGDQRLLLESLNDVIFHIRYVMK
ncbi:neuraminidase-like domain-containing protein [Paenibacillus thiaminolyticus]|uniref:Tc toxin subunit A-related protein n=1 Tax=Paenibacillus thiaminolyticus TaxID=49283 RepID=UPI0025439548|nr:neuraminidase-like domain-containing protein [Paenibacillus thiaminolyticus]WII40069.1 neuraminidase-like domain-containing protein [Paenibacillus thiaminolyticus]